MKTSKNIKGKPPPRDLRTLCYRCYAEMERAGISLKRAGGARSRCDKCNKPGSNWEVN